MSRIVYEFISIKMLCKFFLGKNVCKRNRQKIGEGELIWDEWKREGTVRLGQLEMWKCKKNFGDSISSPPLPIFFRKTFNFFWFLFIRTNRNIYSRTCYFENGLNDEPNEMRSNWGITYFSNNNNNLNLTHL